MRPARAMGLIVAMVLLMVMAGLALSAPPAQAQALFGTTSPTCSGGQRLLQHWSHDGRSDAHRPRRVFLGQRDRVSSDDRGVVRRGL